MGLLISWKNRTRTSVVRAGYLFCRKCLCRTPGEMVLAEEVTYLWGVIPVGVTGASRNLLRCTVCDSTFDEAGDWAFDFGDHVAPQTWDCRRCGELNTSERFNCRRCGKRI